MSEQFDPKQAKTYPLQQAIDAEMSRLTDQITLKPGYVAIFICQQYDIETECCAFSYALAVPKAETCTNGLDATNTINTAGIAACMLKPLHDAKGISDISTMFKQGLSYLKRVATRRSIKELDAIFERATAYLIEIDSKKGNKEAPMKH